MASAGFRIGWLESQIELEKVIALDRNFAPAEVQLGYTLNALGQPEAALPHFEKALELSPRDRTAIGFTADWASATCFWATRTRR